MSSDGPGGSAKVVSSGLFRSACGRFATGVSIASVLDVAGAPHGLTVNSFSSVSLDPPLILVCLGHAVAAIDHFRRSRHFGINVLQANQQSLSERFARRGHDRFNGLPWRRGQTGVPLLEDVLATMECEVRRRITAGDHDIFIAEMVHAQVHEGDPLIYFRGRYRELI